MRTRIRIACALVAFAISSGIAGAGSANATNYGKANLKKMARDAHTPEQYRVLASFNRIRQQQFAVQAHDEIAWYARRSLNLSLPAAKYPVPRDSSKNRYEYFNYESQRMSRQAAHYESLLANTPQ